MEVNKKTIVLLVVVLIIIIAVFLVVKFYKSNVGETGGNLAESKQEIIKVSEEDYQRELKQAVDSLMADPTNPAVVSSTKEKILDLSVPSDYRQLHLDLVLAIERLQADQLALEDIEEIIANNEWLK